MTQLCKSLGNKQRNMKFSNVRGFLNNVAKCDMISFTHKDYIFVSSALQPSF